MKTLVLDCSYIGHRAKYAMQNLSWKEKQTGVIFGLLSKTIELAVKFETNRIVFAWDSYKSLRKEIYDGYKLHTEELSKEDAQLIKFVHEQLLISRLEVLPKIGFRNSFVVSGYEADDVIASIVFKLWEAGGKSSDSIVVSRDKDLYQLLNYCTMYDPETKALYTSDSLKEEWNCTPNQWRWVKAVGGCASDKVPGVKGVAEKTVIRYLHDELPVTSKAYRAIINGKEIIRRNELLTGLPFPGFPDLALQSEEFFLDDFLDVCREYGFNSFTDKTKKFNQWRDTFNMKRRNKK